MSAPAKSAPAKSAEPSDPSIDRSTECVDDIATEVVVLDPNELASDGATEVVVAGGEKEVVSADDLDAVLPPTSLPVPPIEAVARTTRLQSLENEVDRLRRVAASLDERVVELVENLRNEERRGDTWQELALRGEERVRECTLELERYRGFAHSPWWVRMRGL